MRKPTVNITFQSDAAANAFAIWLSEYDGIDDFIDTAAKYDVEVLGKVTVFYDTTMQGNVLHEIEIDGED